MAYLKSCVWLWLPPLAASFLFWPSLPAAYQPEVFWADIPAALGLVENVSRIVVIGLSAFMVFELHSKCQRIGGLLYLVGFGLYVACQFLIVGWPQSSWATSFIGFLAPAYTPVVWIVGMGLIGQKFMFPLARSGAYLFWVSALIFLVAHNLHAILIFGRL